MEDEDEVIPQWKLDNPTWKWDRHEAGTRAMQTNKARYGDGSDGKPSFTERIGRAGGLKSRNTAWTKSPEGKAHMREMGRKGGSASRRGKAR